VERVQQMFPQVSRRSIMWDLQRNGGNVVATTERILSGRGLEEVSLAGFPLPCATSETVEILLKDTEPSPKGKLVDSMLMLCRS
jgi:hypothetical protein